MATLYEIGSIVSQIRKAKKLSDVPFKFREPCWICKRMLWPPYERLQHIKRDAHLVRIFNLAVDRDRIWLATKLYKSLGANLFFLNDKIEITIEATEKITNKTLTSRQVLNLARKLLKQTFGNTER